MPTFPNGLNGLIFKTNGVKAAIVTQSTSSLSLAPGGRVKIGRLVRDPAQKFRHLRIGHQRLSSAAQPHKLRIGEAGVDRAMANRMDRHRDFPPLSLGNDMVELHTPPKRALTQPADRALVTRVLANGHREANQALSQGCDKPVSR
ncbi:hypothetical protein [Aurantiacibacter suaedae]|uniref:hypothetical protein n=1 Tax=Aurantiacibacter suaedae TaxID=2545755 RepID=UPI001386F746